MVVALGFLPASPCAGTDYQTDRRRLRVIMNDPRLIPVLGQLEFARNYTQSLLADWGDDEWFAMPAGSPTHLAWQVGHLAMAEYGLGLYRQRGRSTEDKTLMSSQFRKLFSRGTTPDANPAAYPPIAEIHPHVRCCARPSAARTAHSLPSNSTPPPTCPTPAFPQLGRPAVLSAARNSSCRANRPPEAAARQTSGEIILGLASRKRARSSAIFRRMRLRGRFVSGNCTTCLRARTQIPAGEKAQSQVSATDQRQQQ